MADNIIIVAGGKGLRMGEPIPKQFLPLAGKTILMLTIERFYSFDPNINIVVALPAEQREYWNKLCRECNFNIPHAIVDGGETRFHSVSNALDSITDPSGLTGVHDGVRPFVSLETIRKCYLAASKFGAAIPVTRPLDSLREVKEGNSIARLRDNYRLVQTPQVFRTDLLKQAYRAKYKASFTDDASVVEDMAHKIELVEGNIENIKITTPFDLLLAQTLVSQQKD